MSYEYDQYLNRHKHDVGRGLAWLLVNFPDLIRAADYTAEWNVMISHDQSKSTTFEYEAYDAFFYGKNKSYAVVQNFNKAWLHHIHNNPHHWQHWILINDDPEEGTILIEMPYEYIIEMICDWWSFSWKTGKLDEIFKWYDEHKKHIQLHSNTRRTVELILEKMKKKLEELGNEA